MRMVVVVVLEPSGDLAECLGGARQGVDADIVALEGLDEGLADAVALRAGDRSKIGHQAQLGGKAARRQGGVGRSVVGQELDPVRSPEVAKALLHGLQQHVAHVRSGDPGTGHSFPGDDLAIVGIDDEGSPDHLATPAGELQAVRTPPQVGAQDDDLAIVEPTGPSPPSASPAGGRGAS